MEGFQKFLMDPYMSLRVLLNKFVGNTDYTFYVDDKAWTNNPYVTVIVKHSYYHSKPSAFCHLPPLS